MRTRWMMVVGAGIVVGMMTASAADPGLLPPAQEGVLLTVPKGAAGATIPAFVTTKNDPAKARTSATVRWDDAGLAVVFDCADANIIAKDRKRDDPEAWQDDCVEIFLDPGHTHDYESGWIHILVTASGAIYDERGPVTNFYVDCGEAEGGQASWNADGLTTTVERSATGWQARIVLPWGVVGTRPVPGDAWGLNLCREDHPAEEYQSWSPTLGPYHRIHRWGHVLFTGPNGETSATAESRQVERDVFHGMLEKTGFDPALARYFAAKGRSAALADRPAAAPVASLPVKITPKTAGLQMVRVALPLPVGFLHADEELLAADGGTTVTTAVRILTWHAIPASETPSVRRALVTFPYRFPTLAPVSFTFRPVPATARPSTSFPLQARLEDGILEITGTGFLPVRAKLIGPPRTAKTPPRVQVVEDNTYFRWLRFTLDDSAWPRVIETRMDSLGTVAVIAHLQCNDPLGIRSDDYYLAAPYFGWELKMTNHPATPPFTLEVAGQRQAVTNHIRHGFSNGVACALAFHEDAYQAYHPAAPFKLRGMVDAVPGGTNGSPGIYRYLLSTPWEPVPMQGTGWRKVEFVIAPVGQAPLTETLEYPHTAEVDWKSWDGLYQTGAPLDLRGQPELAKLVAYHHEAILAASCQGDDWGNVSGFDPQRPHHSVFSQNRLNHCPAIFEEGYRSGDWRLVQAGVLWCENYNDLSLCWDPGNRGGARYPGQGRFPRLGVPPGVATQYMWRADAMGHAFTTKGASSFFMAYEQTGDPRFLEGLGAQNLFLNRYIVEQCTGGGRHIGIAIDFLRQYRWTGRREYLDRALAMFRVVRKAVGPDGMYGDASKDHLFVAGDREGYSGKFLKPYMYGYGLESLPALLGYASDEPRLKDVVTALANHMEKAQDPLGVWRYPHPRSPTALCSQSLEHAHHLVNAEHSLGTTTNRLDAIERFLRFRIQVWQKTGGIMTSCGGFEHELAKKRGEPPPDLWKMYKLATDRDYTRDYDEGALNMAGVEPEGLVYFSDVLRYYLEHRSAERLLAPPEPGSPLARVLARLPAADR